MSQLVSRLLIEDSVSFEFKNIGCFDHFNCKGRLSTRSLKYEEISRSYLRRDTGYFVFQIDSLDKTLSDDEMILLQELFTLYGGRTYRMSSTSHSIYKLIGKDTSVTIENHYSYDGNPLDKLDDIFQIDKAYEYSERRILARDSAVYFSYR